MHFEIWWPFAFVLGLTGIQAVQKIVISLIERRKSAPPPALEELAQNVERINQAVDAIALEVERIGESQRFLTKVMSSTASLEAPAGQRDSRALETR